MDHNNLSDSPKLSRGIHLNATILFVDGITRAGKSMMGPILASFQRVEIERLEVLTEYIGTIYRMGKVSQDAAVALLKSHTDLLLYYGLIGRNTNFRFGDHSSVWRNPNRFRYLNRIFRSERDVLTNRVPGEGVIYQNQTHEQIANFELYYEAFSERLRIIEIIRHPVDLIDSWLRRGWGERHGSDPIAFTLCIRYQEQDLPYYATGWEATYLACSPPGRVIRMIRNLWDDNQTTYGSLSSEKKDQVFVISFEDFIQRPLPYLEPIGDFLGSKTTRHTASALRRQRCPRAYSLEERLERQRRLEEQASPEEREMLERLIDEYEVVRAAAAVSIG